MADEVIPPVVCTLSMGRKENQILEWGDLAALTLTTTELANGVVSTYPLTVAAQVEDLAQRESRCCGSWLTVVHTRTRDSIRLEITTPNPEGLELIRRISGLQDAR